jgi:hypothetical protein
VILRNLWFKRQEGLLPKDEWDDDMKIFDLDWSQYDHFCHEYQQDNVVTMPAPAVPIGYKQLWTSAGRDKGIRQDLSKFLHSRR